MEEPSIAIDGTNSRMADANLLLASVLRTTQDLFLYSITADDHEVIIFLIAAFYRDDLPHEDMISARRNGVNQN